jgi:hypothetical protein
MLEILTALFPPWFYKACGVGQQWPLPDEELGLIIDEKG